MKKLLILTFALLVSLSLFGRPKENPRITDERVTDWLLDQLRDAGYTVLPEIIVQDTLNRSKQKFSSRYETKGGRGMMMPNWANDSTWSPGMKEPKKEWDDLYFNPKTDQQRKPKHRNQIDQIVDTLVKENPEIVVNNYYNDDPFFYSNHIGRFYHGGFNYWMYQNPFYYYNYWFYSDFGWGWSPYYGYNFPYYNNFYFGYNNYWGWNFGWNWYHPYYQPYYHNNYFGYNGGNHNNNNIGRRDRPSNYTQNIPPSNRRIENTQPQRNRAESPQTRPMYSESRRSYTPSYETPRMSTRPNFNNSRVSNGNMNRGNMQNMENRRENMNGNMGNMRGNMNRSMGNTNVQTMPNSRRETPTQTRTYSPSPNRENFVPSRNYSEPSRNFNSGGDMSRRSNSSGFSNTSNSGGGSSRSSNGSSSSGTSNNSGGNSPTRR